MILLPLAYDCTATIILQFHASAMWASVFTEPSTIKFFMRVIFLMWKSEKLSPGNSYSSSGKGQYFKYVQVDPLGAIKRSSQPVWLGSLGTHTNTFNTRYLECFVGSAEPDCSVCECKCCGFPTWDGDAIEQAAWDWWVQRRTDPEKQSNYVLMSRKKKHRHLLPRLFEKWSKARDRAGAR